MVSSTAERVFFLNVYFYLVFEICMQTNTHIGHKKGFIYCQIHKLIICITATDWQYLICIFWGTRGKIHWRLSNTQFHITFTRKKTQCQVDRFVYTKNRSILDCIIAKMFENKTAHTQIQSNQHWSLTSEI